MNAKKLVRTAGVATTAAVAVLGFQSAASASAPSTVYVSSNVVEVNTASTATGYGSACQHTTVHSIQQGVSMVAAGGTVNVCPGTYFGSVDIRKTLTLKGLGHPTLDAKDYSYGIGIGADHVTVTGMRVVDAGVNTDPTSGALGDGIVTASLAGYPKIGNYATITDNTATANMGAGIDVNSARGTLVQNNHADGNAIGINLNTDLSYPVRDSRIIGNTANDNQVGCGIAVADHTGAGIINNLVKNNVANGNGLPAGGAGVLLAEPSPGGVVRNNSFVGNSASGNGHSGFELHIHVPDAQVSGNSVTGNTFGTNNSGGDYGDPDTTGIYLGSASPMSIVVKNNHIHDDVNGIFQAGPVTTVRSGNTFTNVTHTFVSTPTYAG
jgi:parallel beta-helix repeat protein